MEHRQLGQGDLHLSVITFGAWAIGGWLWGGAEKKESINAIKAAVDAGISSIDTAPVYGQGLSEEIVGEALHGTPRYKVQICTKYGMRWDINKGDFGFHSKDNAGNEIDIYKYAGKESIIKECEDSLRRLHTDYIDLYQIHWPDITTPIEETMEAVAKLLQQGKIKAAGVCNYNVEQMKAAENVISLASNQVPYSMLNKKIESEVVPYCLQNKKGILAYSPLQRGLLTGKIKKGYHFSEGDSRPDTRYYQPENIDRVNAFLDKLRPMTEDKKITLAQLVLRWTVSQPGITVALAGARNAKQATENAAATDIKLSQEEINFINQQLESVTLVQA